MLAAFIHKFFKDGSLATSLWSFLCNLWLAIKFWCLRDLNLQSLEVEATALSTVAQPLQSLILFAKVSKEIQVFLLDHSNGQKAIEAKAT